MPELEYDFDYCPLHGEPEKGHLYAWPCPLETVPLGTPEDEIDALPVSDDPDVHCPHMTNHLKNLMMEVEIGGNYSEMLFPARVKDGVVTDPATEGHPDPTGLVDRRIYVIHFENHAEVGEIEPLSFNQNPDGTYRNECAPLCHPDCQRCSWNSNCLCKGKINNDHSQCRMEPYPDDDDDEWPDGDEDDELGWV